MSKINTNEYIDTDDSSSAIYWIKKINETIIEARKHGLNVCITDLKTLVVEKDRCRRSEEYIKRPNYYRCELDVNYDNLYPKKLEIKEISYHDYKNLKYGDTVFVKEKFNINGREESCYKKKSIYYINEDRIQTNDLKYYNLNEIYIIK